MRSSETSARVAGPPATVWITGASGFLGSALAPSLARGGRAVEPLRRGGALPGVPPGPFVVVHLAGENIASGRWTERKKALIRDSRIEGTWNLSQALARLPRRPDALVCASAIGWYGSRGDEVLTEDSGPGAGFLADVCRAWEAATEPAVQSGIRVVPLRFGMILDPAGGALRRMLTPFKLGLGGRIGGGRQFMSWISRDDAVAAIGHAIDTPTLRWPLNAVSPGPVTNAEFTRALGRALGRPTFFPMPAFAARLAFGDMADELLLSSQRVVPQSLEASGFRFRHPRIDDALRDLLGGSA